MGANGPQVIQFAAGDEKELASGFAQPPHGLPGVVGHPAVVGQGAVVIRRESEIAHETPSAWSNEKRSSATKMAIGVPREAKENRSSNHHHPSRPNAHRTAAPGDAERHRRYWGLGEVASN